MAWIRAKFRGKKVWVEAEGAGLPRVIGGRVAMRYGPEAGARIYRAGVMRIEVGTEPPVELPPGAEADRDGGGGGKRKRRGSGFGSAKNRTAAQADAARLAAKDLVASFSETAAVCFTDGSCSGNPGPAGAGAVVRLPGGEKLEGSLSVGIATNNVGELMAVGLALDLLDQAEFPSTERVEILTDSSYVHGVLTQGWKAKANRELILGLRSRLEEREARLHWVAGHAGIEDNERADTLANQGAEESRRG
ncbi:MAG: reverse transcriptase-like protein [Myxococcota bacterium]|jgi:ribonuclease HI|nr:reverse transcriptase-like protein [Myxococcota bacterium]